MLKMNSKKLIDYILFVLIACLFVYSLWFQFVVRSTSGLFLLLGVLIALCAFSKLKLNINYYRYLFGLFGFAVIAGITSVLFAVDYENAISLVVQHIEYILISFAIYTYIGTDYGRFRKVLWTLLIPIVLVAITSVFFGQMQRSGAIVAGSMNPNVQASLLSIGVVVCFILMCGQRVSKLTKIGLITVLIICFISQVLTSSRRGLLVYSFLIVTCLFAVVQVRYRRSKGVKALLFLSIVLLVFIVTNEFLSQSDTLVVMQRLMKKNYLGDQNRNYYQEVAKELFYESPLFGNGFGAVAHYVGVYSHSLYYELLASTGIVGTVVMIGILFNNALVFFRASRVIRKAENEIMLRCMALLMLSVLISGYAVVLIYDLYFYIVIGLMASMRHIISKKWISYV